MKTTKSGGRKSVSLGGGITGFGANLIVIDDLGKPSEMRHDTYRQELRDFFDQTLFSRLNDKRTDRIVSIQQRLHPDDFSAYLLEKDTFDHLCLPSIAEIPEEIPLYNNRVLKRRPGDLLNPEREPQEVLDRIKADIGNFAFQAQYQQNPTDGENEFLSLSDLHLVESLPDESVFVRRVQSWDTAAKDGPRSDFTVGLTFGWHADRVLECTVLRDKVSSALAHLRELVANDTAVSDLMVTVRNALRRKPDANVLCELLAEISVEISEVTQTDTENLRDSDNEIEGHKEDSLSPKVKKEKLSQIQVSPDQMERSFPRLCSELRFAKDQHHCDRLMDDIAQYLRLGQTWYAMKSTFGPAIRFMVLGYIFQRAENIQSPGAYLISLLVKIEKGELSPSAMLTRTSNAS